MSELTIEVQKREETGTNANRRLRAAGVLPGVIYGGGKDSVTIQLDQVTLHRLMKEGGDNAIFLLKLAGTKDSRHAMVRDLDVDPISRRIRHIDFQRILLTEKVRVQVHLEVVGEPEGVKNEDGVLDFVTREIGVESLPGKIPSAIVVDVSALHVGQHLEVGDLEIPEDVEVTDDPSRVVVSIGQSRVAASLEEAEEEAGAEEDLIEAERDEPEVIGKGKESEEGEES